MLRETNYYAQTKQTKERGTIGSYLHYRFAPGYADYTYIIQLTHLGLVTLYCVLEITKLLKLQHCIWLKNVLTCKAFCKQISEHEPNHRLNTLRPRQNGGHFKDDIFKYIFLNKNVWIFVKMALKFVPKGPINTISALVQIMAWRRPSEKPLSETIMNSLLSHICVTRLQWVINGDGSQCGSTHHAHGHIFGISKFWIKNT